MQSFWHKLEYFSHKLIPCIITGLMALITVLPFPIAGISALMPSLTLINIYYWYLLYPGSMPYIFLFVLGILEDVLAGNPLGISSFINILFAFILMSKRRMLGKMLFGSIWFGFIVLSLGAELLKWGVISIYYNRALPIRDSFLIWEISCFFYPMFHIFLTRVYRFFARISF
jgi:rod shape-determining protein MreD